jgi:DNA-3-methyladenine glycosylase
VRHSFYDRPVLEVARDLIGCVVSHEGCSGVIVEAEAYHDSEPACHAFVGLTPRTAILFGPPGYAYVYRSYGIHALLNAVCEPEGVGAAVLIRALEPVEGVDLMRERRGLDDVRRLCSGPGKLTQALGIGLADNGCDLARGPVVFSPRPRAWRDVDVSVDTRVGINKAVELPWRFLATGSRFVSRPMRQASAGKAPPTNGEADGVSVRQSGRDSNSDVPRRSPPGLAARSAAPAADPGAARTRARPRAAARS